ncbi:pyridoxamine 5'-phosphate oxidase family protein [Haloarcula onubensis]|uniref:Pyridoxamine 5'-phosphate oxidase family protein n=1 Tax=Haloarcula onubensis TaxID=2950539 RepID=A0ABU2FNM5_9EURY|nr:pyridoxamine 5'-phosphate oxidase family protein [Halomicroarcula sp. S3CR25-11]MDS0281891.1 pyridoxamine 5'-phosphate oxidase family protein [Halomicroarcula sp. S3CR25-11]
MDPDVRFAYTRAMSQAEIESRLRDVGHGVLSLADGDDSYAIPLYHHYEDGTFFFRLGETPDNSKGDYIETTETATYVVFEAEETAEAAQERGWSVIARGPIERVPRSHPVYDVQYVNEQFAPIRIFDEAHDEVELTLYELQPEVLSGRQN